MKTFVTIFAHVLGCAACFLIAGCPARPTRFEASADLADPIATGRRIYLEKCAVCHGETGEGVSGRFPPLAGVPWVNGDPQRLAALTLDGLTGKRKIAGTEYNGVMPAWRGVLTAPEIAAVLTYLRQTWSNHAPAISTGFVHQISDRYASRRSFWTPAELEAVADDR